ncbi:MAG: hypothetical protein LWW77_07055 [Propionibacteriales bacterium]|nr:hypothetical protein [Propionibacteriales bacterium]
MIENLKRFREPLAWLAIALTLLGIGLTAWRLVTGLREGTVTEAFQDVGGGWLNAPLTLVVVVIVLSCSLVTPALRRALVLTRIAAAVLGAGVLLTLASVLMGMWASFGATVLLDLLGGLLDAAFKALLAATLWIFLRGVKAGRIETAPRTVPMPQLPVETVEPGEATAEPQSTTWTRDAAAGSVWWTADAAAAGEPGKDRMPEVAEPAEAERPRTGD